MIYTYSFKFFHVQIIHITFVTFFKISTPSEFLDPVCVHKCLQEEGEGDGSCCNFLDAVLPRSSKRE